MISRNTRDVCGEIPANSLTSARDMARNDKLKLCHYQILYGTAYPV